MAKGIITTARGGALNIDELILMAQRPPGYKEEHSTRETANYKTPVNNTPRVRGFVPTSGASTAPVFDVPEAKSGAGKKAKVTQKPDTTMADLTKVTVKKTPRIEKAIEMAKAVATGVDQTDDDEDEVLGDIMSDIESDGGNSSANGKKS